jgi:hypothetical protein
VKGLRYPVPRRQEVVQAAFHPRQIGISGKTHRHGPLVPVQFGPN